jgi:hypothetical protein
MNKQIRELALQAGGSHYPDVNSRQLEKFSELLINECCKIMIDLESSVSIAHTVHEIKKHFGVEEE